MFCCWLVKRIAAGGGPDMAFRFQARSFEVSTPVLPCLEPDSYFCGAVLGAYGLALMMGALGLLFKRIQQMFALVQFALLFLLTAPTETWSGLLLQVGNLLLPMTISASVLRDLMARNQSLNFYHLAFALLNGVGYFALGNFIFRWAERKAKLIAECRNQKIEAERLFGQKEIFLK